MTSTRNCAVRRRAKPERPHEVQVQHLEVRPANALDTEGKLALLEVGRRLGGILLEPGVGVEPAIERRVVDGDVVQVAIEEDVAPTSRPPGWYSNVPPVCHPPTSGRPQPPLFEEWLAAAERQLRHPVRAEAMRPAVRVRLPQVRRPIELVDRFQIPDLVARVADAGAEAVGEPAREVDLHAMRLRHAERQVGVRRGAQLWERSAQQTWRCTVVSGEERVAGHARIQRRVAGLQRSEVARQ